MFLMMVKVETNGINRITLYDCQRNSSAGKYVSIQKYNILQY